MIYCIVIIYIPSMNEGETNYVVRGQKIHLIRNNVDVVIYCLGSEEMHHHPDREERDERLHHRHQVQLVFLRRVVPQ